MESNLIQQICIKIAIGKIKEMTLYWKILYWLITYQFPYHLIELKKKLYKQNNK